MGTLNDGLKVQASFTGHSPNLFEVSIFGEDTTTPTVLRDVNGRLIRFYSNDNGGEFAAKYYCSAYDLPPPSIKVSQDPFTKKHYLEKYTIPDIVTITWQEDKNQGVWWYHKHWFDCYYNRSTDTFKTGAAGKKRNVKINVQGFKCDSIPHAMNDNDFSTRYIINLFGLVPKFLPPLKGAWSEDASNTTLQIQYSVDYIVFTDSTATSLGAI